MLPKPNIQAVGAGGAPVIDTTATPVNNGSTSNGDTRANGRANPVKAKEEPKEPGWWQRLVEMADKQQQLRREESPRQPKNPPKKKRK
jgi:hypothetical protein